MTLFGMTRVKNESRWIKMVLESYLPICERIWLFDDNSTDGTPELAEQLDERITVIRSPFTGLDETRDKSYLLGRVMGSVSDIHLRGNPRSPFWVVCFDGDELLDPAGLSAIKANLLATRAHSFRLPIRFLWDSDLSLLDRPGHRRVRVDGVYRRFADVGRPSIFRLFNAAFGFQSTPWGGNFHCASIPQELLDGAHETLPAPVWHLGYNNHDDRVRKFAWYSEIDPRNEVEGRYLHMIQGDGVVVDGVAITPDLKLKHAGPLRLEMM